MIEKEEIACLVDQMRAVLLRKEIPKSLIVENEELQELQGAIEYLSSCLKECQSFMENLCAGQLNGVPPGRHNFIASHLKELHSILKHMTWQTTQVANGDYSQQVRFLGEFSDSFNIMIRQLKEREISLSKKSNALSQSMNMLKSVLDGQKEWVIVIDEEKEEVIYANQSADSDFYSLEKGRAACEDYGEILEKLMREDCPQSKEREYECENLGIMLQVRSFPIEWNDRKAFAHCIYDVTDEREEKEKLQNLAYRDTLTEVYNRRYCLGKLERLKKRKISYSLVMLDLDGLKQVNDGLGHTYGDDYICTVASEMRDQCQEYDRICRIGGDEFIWILPGCSEKTALLRLNDISTRLGTLDKPYPISISYGVVYVDVKNQDKTEQLFEKADAKMYLMKQEHKSEV